VLDVIGDPVSGDEVDRLGGEELLGLGVPDAVRGGDDEPPADQRSRAVTADRLVDPADRALRVFARVDADAVLRGLRLAARLGRVRLRQRDGKRSGQDRDSNPGSNSHAHSSIFQCPNGGPPASTANHAHTYLFLGALTAPMAGSGACTVFNASLASRRVM
jgi:hypothetical protein